MNEKPLLHYWSLAVEEQFYLIWPLFLMFFYQIKNAKVFLISLTLLALFSFIAAQYYFPTSPSFVYYMLPTRAGELLVGAIVAYIIHINCYQSLHKSSLNFIAYSGFVLIILSILCISEDTIFSGFIALLPTIGTAFVIFPVSTIRIY